MLAEKLDLLVNDEVFAKIVSTHLRRGELLDYANIPLDTSYAYLSFVGHRSRKVFTKDNLTYLCVTYYDNYIVEEIKFNSIGKIISCT